MPNVSIVECKSYNDKEVFEAVKKAIKSINFKIRPKSKVLLKPNVLLGARPEKGITTNPAILSAVCKFLKEKECEITIADSFGVVTKTAKETFRICGIEDVAKKYNAELLSFSAAKLKKITNKKAVFGREMMLPSLLKEVDLVINMPKFKTHALTVFTGAVKNLFGCIPGGKKQAYHAEAGSREKFSNLLLDIWLNVRPKLSIMDAVIGMDGEGPSQGTLKKLGFVMASDNAIAMDLVAEKIARFENRIPTNSLALKRKLIRKEDIKVQGKIPEIKFNAPRSTAVLPSPVAGFFLKRTIAYPVVDKKKCTKCWTCVKVCPVSAMEKKSFPHLDRKKCIACYCCQELCPYGAIELKQNAFFRQAIRLYHFVLNMLKRRKAY